MRWALRALRSWCKQAGEHEERGRKGGCEEAGRGQKGRCERAGRDGMGWKGGRMGVGKGGEECERDATVKVLALLARWTGR